MIAPSRAPVHHERGPHEPLQKTFRRPHSRILIPGRRPNFRLQSWRQNEAYDTVGICWCLWWCLGCWCHMVRRMVWRTLVMAKLSGQRCLIAAGGDIRDEPNMRVCSSPGTILLMYACFSFDEQSQVDLHLARAQETLCSSSVSAFCD